jgi:hypothetical protein
MKKILFACLAAMLMCSCGQQFGLAYGVSLSGVGDGKFDVTFPQGSFAMDGTAAIDFVIGDTIPFGTVTTKADVELINRVQAEGKLPKMNIVFNGVDLKKKKYGFYYGYGRYGGYSKYGTYYGRYGHYGTYGNYGDKSSRVEK